ncbi:uncharacterized protein LACBIDRAFT_303135 [Laccaria bicolor S238N-H82]|uniref:Predicted protein n=1 Tax=Laccaria bicolor (strain S238N-H82 / ATCC MYA-4686) TaxID=486041 RepID=B0DJ03_LACBS|nr:uncharacterized protein LACBIDRAFT_303135 [Laccaria bicolor S238N-H82]EDR05432.1 predicted protein [Laccaria bicolor S238N-H82]|eukprot:XP_001883990.1 predicted protein [Laccaria bicolor S238N-H82]
MSSRTALKTFSLTNDILEVTVQDEIYRFDAEANRWINQEAPWTKECVPSNYHPPTLLAPGDGDRFKSLPALSCPSPQSCKISAVALIKMVCGTTLKP